MMRAPRSRPRSGSNQARASSSVAHHHREGLVRASLAFAQAGDRGVVGGVACQVESAEALDGHDPPARDQGRGGLDDVGGVAGGSAVAVEERERGPHAGHATGSAWKRRSAGSSYSRRQSSHMGNARIDVRSRS